MAVFKNAEFAFMNEKVKVFFLFTRTFYFFHLQHKLLIMLLC
jgi:hypothetical protein